MNLKESWGLYVGGLGGAKKKERNVIIVPKTKKKKEFFKEPFFLFSMSVSENRD